MIAISKEIIRKVKDGFLRKNRKNNKIIMDFIDYE